MMHNYPFLFSHGGNNRDRKQEKVVKPAPTPETQAQICYSVFNECMNKRHEVVTPHGIESEPGNTENCKPELYACLNKTY